MTNASLRPFRLLLVDDHPLFRAGLAAALRVAPELNVCAEAAGSNEALALAAQHQPEVAVVDLMLAEGDGLKLVRELRQRHPSMRLAVLSMLEPATYEARALQAGADVFISKREGPDAIVEQLRRALQGGRAARAAAAPAEDVALLSERELQVFRELGLGRSTQEIAATLGVSVKTVESHREGIKLKLGLPHANALVARAALWAREQGLAG